MVMLSNNFIFRTDPIALSFMMASPSPMLRFRTGNSAACIYGCWRKTPQDHDT